MPRFRSSLGACIVLGNFQQVAVFMMVPFLPPWFWEHLLPKLGIGRRRRPAGDAGAPEDATLPGREWRSDVSPEPARESSQRGPRRRAGCLLAHHELGGCLVRGNLPGRPERLAYALNFDQNWDLFSLPEVDKPFGWLVAPAKLADGRTVDLFTGSPRSTGHRRRRSRSRGT